MATEHELNQLQSRTSELQMQMSPIAERIAVQVAEDFRPWCLEVGRTTAVSELSRRPEMVSEVAEIKAAIRTLAEGSPEGVNAMLAEEAPFWPHAQQGFHTPEAFKVRETGWPTAFLGIVGRLTRLLGRALITMNVITPSSPDWKTLGAEVTWHGPGEQVLRPSAAT